MSENNKTDLSPSEKVINTVTKCAHTTRNIFGHLAMIALGYTALQKNVSDMHYTTEKDEWHLLREKTPDPFLKEITADGVITDDELIDYGYQSGLVYIFDEKEFDELQSVYKRTSPTRVKNDNYIIPDWDLIDYFRNNRVADKDDYEDEPYDNAHYYRLDINDHISIDTLIQRAQEKNIANIVFEDSHYRKPVAYTTPEELVEIEKTFRQMQKQLNLQNIPLYIGNYADRNTYADMETWNCNVHVDMRYLQQEQEVFEFAMASSLTDIRQSIGYSRYTNRIKRLLTGKMPDYKSEQSYSDSVAAHLVPNAASAAYSTFLGNGLCSEASLGKALQENAKNANNMHSSNTDRLRKIMQISASRLKP